jgi:Predicted polymerase, most proteins contain PALM domain, HD hydrolase domain and Zn-ribbon domain
MSEIIDANDSHEGRKEPASGGPSVRDASYALEYAEDGVFLLINYEDAGGKPLQAEAIIYDLGRRNLRGLNTSEIPFRLRRRDERIRIADAQDEPAADSDMMVWITQGEMSVEMLLLPPCGGGGMKSAEEVLELIRKKWGVVFGLNEATVKTIVEKRAFYQRIAIASGRLPENGMDGRIVFLFNTTHTYAPKAAADGSSDYRNLDIFESVTEGATLVTMFPPEEGVEGYTVTGTKLPAKKGLAVKLPKGKNVRISEDGRNLIATKSGRVDFINDRVEVADVFRVAGDVDMGVGNIQFEGDVIIFGNVISGLKVEASGMIEIGGYVEGSTLIAGKDIILRNGMQGTDKGRLIAGGNIVARFLDHCEAEAKGNIFADYIVKCRGIACGSITAKGKWGRILGGVVRAGKEITASTIGSPSHELTVLELGSSPDLRAKCTKLEAAKNQIKIQLDKISNVSRVIPSHSDSPERQEMRLKLISAKDQLLLQYNDIVAEIESLAQILSDHSGARLHVFKTIYPNVKVIIDSCSMTTKSTIEFATFSYRDGEVVFAACEARP